jgi:methylated-DNA-protein-cysteine methyltransferase-like protein
MKPETLDFYSQVYDLVRLIPKGRVCTYGMIAKCLGASKSSRLVGYAMNESHKEVPQVPAHRVVNRNGLLTGKHHFETPTTMQELLELEGIQVLDDTIVDFEKLIWDPQA